MIVDAAGNLVSARSMSGRPGDEVAAGQRVECIAGHTLTAASDDPGVVIWAKAEPGDAFQNIQTTPIDLTPFDGTTKLFYFECRIDPDFVFDTDEPPALRSFQIIVER